MKNWFPFTDYDFYAYITAGMLLIAAADFTFGGSVLISRTEWTVVQVVFWTAIAYVAGQIVAGPSSALLEHFIARQFLHPPSTIILGLENRRWREIVVASLFAGREYAPFPAPLRSQALGMAAKALELPSEDLRDAEAVFGVAFVQARKNSDAAARMDQFRNLYGFSRNISFSCLLAAGLLGVRLRDVPEARTAWLLGGALVISLGMFGRFVKFYAAYSQEVFRAYIASKPTESGAKSP